MPTGSRTQKDRQFAIATPLGDDVLLFKRMAYREALGRPFEIELELISEDAAIEAEKLLGENVTVRAELPNLDGKTRYFNGQVAEFSQAGTEEGAAVYRMRVVPWLWFLSRTSDCRMFQEMTAVDIIKQVFRDFGFTDFRESLAAQYRTWDYCAQYRETAFDFVSRIMEQEGIYYYFEHENGKHTLVLIDDAASHESFPDYKEIEFRPYDRVMADAELIHEFDFTRAVQPGAFAQTDFDFAKPTKDLASKSAVNRDHNLGDFELFDFPGEYAEAAEGDRYTAVRLDEHQARYAVAKGKGDCRGVATGRVFTLAEHPIESQNSEYLVIDTTIVAEGDPYGSTGRSAIIRPDSFKVSFACIPATQQYRPARVTPLPFVRGPQTALVVGPSGEEIHTDEHGRVKVMFHWDREAKGDETSSCWIRVSQEFAGKGWGSMQIPRVGHEVIVSFLEGDPDRPLITGRVYNGDNPPPYDPKQFATITAWKTNSSKGGGGFNELRFDDKKDKEMVWLHAQKRCDFRIRGTFRETNYGNREVRVGWEKDGDSGGDYNTYVHKDTNLHVKGAGYVWYEDKMHSLFEGEVITEIDADRSVNITGNDQLSATEILIQGSDQISQKSDMIIIGGATSVDVKAGSSIAIESSSSLTLKAGTEIVLEAGGSKIGLNSGGVKIYGTMVDLNTAPPGPADSAQEALDANDAVLDGPLDALVADDGKPGKVASVGGRGRQRTSRTITPTPVPPFTPPPPPKVQTETPPKQPEQPTSTKPCGIQSLKVRCEHKVNGRERWTDGTRQLEVVPSSGARTASVQGTWFGKVSVQTQRRWSGNDKLVGSVTVMDESKAERKEIVLVKGRGEPPASGWKKDTAGETISAPEETGTAGWCPDFKPVVYTLYGRGCDDTTQSITIEAFPSDKREVAIGLSLFGDTIEAITKRMNTIFGKVAACAPVRPQFAVNGPTGSLKGAWGWDEDQDWQAFFLAEAEVGLAPLIGLTFRLDVSLVAVAGAFVAVPPAISNIVAEYGADIFFRLEVGGSVSLTGGPRWKRWHAGKSQTTGTLKAGGQVQVTCSLGGRIGADAVISAEVTAGGRSGISPSAEFEIGEQGCTVQPKLDWDGLQLVGKIVLRAMDMDIEEAEGTITVINKVQVYPDPDSPSDPIKLFPND